MSKWHLAKAAIRRFCPREISNVLRNRLLMLSVLPSEEKSQSRGKYDSYSKEQRAMIGKYAPENGPTSAAKHYTEENKVSPN